jgi:hypothetical protein
MPAKKTADTFSSRAKEVRRIAGTLYDNIERQKVLRFVTECEKLAAH